MLEPRYVKTIQLYSSQPLFFRLTGKLITRLHGGNAGGEICFGGDDLLRR